MRCAPFQVRDEAGNVTGGGFVCTSGRKAKPKACITCGKAAALLCDGPPPAKSKRHTCDAPICAKHAHEIGPDCHHCPPCAEAERARLAAEAAKHTTRAKAITPPAPAAPAMETRSTPAHLTELILEGELEPLAPAQPDAPKKHRWYTPPIPRPVPPDPWIAFLQECPERRSQEEHAGRVHVHDHRDEDSGPPWTGIPRRVVLQTARCVASRPLEHGERVTAAFSAVVALQRQEEARARLRLASLQARGLTDPEQRAAFADEFAPLAWNAGPPLHPPPAPPTFHMQRQDEEGRRLDKLTAADPRTTTQTAHHEEPRCTPISASTRAPHVDAA